MSGRGRPVLYVIAGHNGAGGTTLHEEVLVHRTAVSAGDEVSPYTHVVMSGRSSMRISMEAWRRARDSDATNKVTQATFTFVAIDGERHSRPLQEAG